MVSRGHRRQPSEYDGSDYGGDSDMDSPGIPPGLQSRMDMVESLARRGTENSGTDRDGVVNRVIEGLKDLGGQSGVEGGATRFAPSSFSVLSTNLMIDLSQHIQHYPHTSFTKHDSYNHWHTHYFLLCHYHQMKNSSTISCPFWSPSANPCLDRQPPLSTP